MEEEIELNLDDEDKIKEVTTTIANRTCQSIIKELSKKEMTESELSKRLNLPLSTVHYNLMKLLKAGIIASERFKYSNRGREVKYYKTTKKRIIIRTSISKKIFTLLAYITAGVGGILFLLERNKIKYEKSSQSIMVESGKSSMIEAANLGARNTTANTHTGVLVGIVTFAVIVLAWLIIRKMKNKDKTTNRQ